MELLTSDKPIHELEELIIKPYLHLNPSLGIILSESATANEKYYAKSIQELGEKFNINVIVKTCSSIPDAGFAISELKRNPKIQGIVNLSNFGVGTQSLNDTIPLRLDVNAYSAITKGKLAVSDGAIGFRCGPCGAAAGLKILHYNNVDFEKKHIAVIGRSIQVGRPLAEMICQQGASVSVFNENFNDINLSYFDAVYNTVNQPNYLDSSFWKDGTDKLEYIVDIGANADENGTTIGSVKLEDFENIDCKIAPLVGCIDRLTIIVLFSKLYVNAATMSGEIL